MTELFVYLLKVNLSLLLFYAVYYLLLRRLTFYTLNRYFLMFAYGFSLIYPLVKVREWLSPTSEIPQQVSMMMPDWGSIQTQAFDVWPVLQAVFWAVVLFFLVRFFIRLISLWRIHQVSVPARWQYFHYRHVLFRINPFTFWKNIYVHVDGHKDQELIDIFHHEQVHVEQLHTLDTLIAEFMTILCWFNPVSWLMRYSIRENLEFITDRRVLQSGVDKRAYQFSLLNLGTSGAPDELVSHFNLKHLKTRIRMMNKKRSSKVQVSKYLIGMPVIVLLALTFTTSDAFEVPVELAEQVTISDAPLLVVDGIPLPTKQTSALNPDIIESISVFKGEVATSRYPGEAQASHGVVEIQTKGQEIEVIVVQGKKMIGGDPMISQPSLTDSTVRIVTGKPIAIRVEPVAIEGKSIAIARGVELPQN